jgi:hypothetical protein
MYATSDLSSAGVGSSDKVVSSTINSIISRWASTVSVSTYVSRYRSNQSQRHDRDAGRQSTNAGRKWGGEKRREEKRMRFRTGSEIRGRTFACCSVAA